jgi:hypothetical protein
MKFSQNTETQYANKKQENHFLIFLFLIDPLKLLADLR